VRPSISLLALLVAACGDPAGTGRLVGSLVVPGCRGGEEARFVCPDDVEVDACEAFDLKPSFFALERFENRAIVRIQRGGNAFAKVDALQIHIQDARRLRGTLGQELSVGPDRDIRAALTLFDRCPDTDVSFELRGKIVFDHFGVSKGDRVAARFGELLVRDGRSGAVLGRLSGELDFTIRHGPPYQQFTSL